MDKSAKSFIKTTNQESKDIIAELNSKDVKASIGARIMRDSTEVKKANDQSKRLGTLLFYFKSVCNTELGELRRLRWEKIFSFVGQS